MRQLRLILGGRSHSPFTVRIPIQHTGCALDSMPLRNTPSIFGITLSIGIIYDAHVAELPGCCLRCAGTPKSAYRCSQSKANGKLCFLYVARTRTTLMNSACVFISSQRPSGKYIGTRSTEFVSNPVLADTSTRNALPGVAGFTHFCELAASFVWFVLVERALRQPHSARSTALIGLSSCLSLLYFLFCSALLLLAAIPPAGSAPLALSIPVSLALQQAVPLFWHAVLVR